MPFDASQPTPTPWTTYEELTPDQRVRYGEYVRLKDDVRADGAWRQARAEAARQALRTAAGDKLKAMAILLSGGQP